jgi:hypothetical protein
MSNLKRLVTDSTQFVELVEGILERQATETSSNQRPLEAVWLGR